MRSERQWGVRAALLTALMAMVGGPVAASGDLGTATTFQGRLLQGGAPVSDLCDFTFRVFDDPNGGTQVGPTLTFDGQGGNPAPLAVTDGLFQAKLDFGPDVFQGAERFLEIRVRCPSGVGAYTTLAPRQPLCAAPYALFALDSPGDFTLPLAVTLTVAEPLLTLTNESTDTDNAVAIRAAATQAGAALRAVAGGTATGGQFQAASSESQARALTAISNAPGVTAEFSNTGDGPVANFLLTGAMNARDAVTVTTAGTGAAGLFSAINPANPTPALVVSSVADDAPGLEARNTGGGPGARIQASGATNTAPALHALHGGPGPAAYLATGQLAQTILRSNVGPATVRAVQSLPAGAAAELLIINPLNPTPPLIVGSLGGGGILCLSGVDDPNNLPSDFFGPEPPAFGAVQQGVTGPAAAFVTTHAESLAPTLTATTHGRGPAAEFVIENDMAGATVQNDAVAVTARTRGYGPAARIEVDNPASEAPALVAVSTAVDGLVALIANNAATPADRDTAAVVGRTTASALHVLQEHANGQIARFEQDAPAVPGNAVTIEVNNALHPLYVQQNGGGEAAHFQCGDPNNTTNAFNTLYAENWGANGNVIDARAHGFGGHVLNAFNTAGGRIGLFLGGPIGGIPAFWIQNSGAPGTTLLVQGDATLGNTSVLGVLTADSANVSNNLCAGSVCAAVKNFHIDHPLDPGNMYLYHASVESDEYKTVYDGRVTTDATGDAVVQLPEWFEALSGDFRYQLTVVGQFADAIIAEEIRDNRFVIRTDKPGVLVCWQVTGVRHDAYARANPLAVEVPKLAGERGRYLHPAAFGQPPERHVDAERRARHAAEDAARAAYLERLESEGTCRRAARGQAAGSDAAP